MRLGSRVYNNSLRKGPNMCALLLLFILLFKCDIVHVDIVMGSVISGVAFVVRYVKCTFKVNMLLNLKYRR